MAGKFNLNQILTDVSKRAVGGEVAQTAAPRPADEIKRISVFDIVPSDDNFYSMNDIEELKGKIELAGKVLQNLVVVPLDGGKYKAISGHRRRLASIALVEEGKPQYEFVPCVVEENEDDAEVQAIREEIMLIAANSQREKTAWDKIEEVRRTRSLLERVKKQNKIPGGTRDIIAKTMNTSPAQIGRYDAIIKNLFPAFMEELKQDRINISTAYELSGLSQDEQREQFYKYQDSGEISIKDARAMKPESPADPLEPGRTEPEPQAPSSSPPKVSTGTQPPREYQPKPTPPPAENGNRQQDKTNIEEPPSPPRPTPPPQEPTKRDEATEIMRDVEQLESLKAYCQAMDESDTDGDSRVWSLDVFALETAIERLKKG